MGNFFQELKRRKVFKVAAVYAVVAWLLIQVTSTILPTFEAPDWVNQTITLLFILGFPVAIILAWAYEVSPDGIQPQAGVPQSTPTASSDSKLLYATFVLVLLVAGFQIADRFTNNPIRDNNIEESPADATVSRFNLVLGESLPKIYDVLPTDISISQDGQTVAYTVNIDGGSELFLRNIDDLTPTRLFSVANADGWGIYKPAFSPNGNQILFGGRGQGLRTISVQGGQTRQLSRDLDPIGGFGWLTDNEVIFVSGEKELQLFSFSENTTSQITIPPAWCQMASKLGNERAFLYTAIGAAQVTHIELFDFQTGVSERLIDNAYQAQFVSSGHIVFMREANLWAVPFDPVQRELTGPQVQVISGISSYMLLSESIYSVSESGRLLYLLFRRS